MVKYSCVKWYETSVDKRWKNYHNSFQVNCHSTIITYTVCTKSPGPAELYSQHDPQRGFVFKLQGLLPPIHDESIFLCSWIRACINCIVSTANTWAGYFDSVILSKQLAGESNAWIKNALRERIKTCMALHRKAEPISALTTAELWAKLSGYKGDKEMEKCVLSALSARGTRILLSGNMIRCDWIGRHSAALLHWPLFSSSKSSVA